MTLKTFIQTLVKPNSIVRLWTKTESGHKAVVIGDDGSYLDMEWSVIKSIYSDKQVLYVADISVSNTEYPEAINIVIEN